MAFKPGPRQLGEILFTSKYINKQQLDEALSIQQKTAKKNTLEELLAGAFFKNKKRFPLELPGIAMIRNLLFEHKFLSREIVEGLIRELIQSHSDRTGLIDLITEKKLLGDDKLMSLYKLQGGQLCRYNIITPDELLEALRTWKKSKKVKPLGKILIDLDYITETQYITAMSKYSRIPIVKFDNIKISKELAQHIPPEIVLKNRILPIQLEKHFLTVAMVFPLDYERFDAMEKFIGLRFNRVLCLDSEFEKMFKMIYGRRMKWY